MQIQITYLYLTYVFQLKVFQIQPNPSCSSETCRRDGSRMSKVKPMSVSVSDHYQQTARHLHFKTLTGTNVRRF